jgi:ADP-ribosylglycohydrolase
MTKGDYLNGVQAGTNLGRDTDTVTNLIGSVAGAMHGIDAIPEDWREAVQELSQPLYDKFRNTSNEFFNMLQTKWAHYREILKWTDLI